MPDTNGKPRTFTPEEMDSRRKMVHNALVNNVMMMRKQLMNRLLDARRDIDKECGYPNTEEITTEMLQDLYDREPVAAKVVEFWPNECWKVQPLVYEVEDSEEATPFEEAWDNLGRQLRGEQSYYQDEKGSPIWDALKRADIQSRIGQYGVILIGIDDDKDLSLPAEFIAKPVEDKAKIGFMPPSDGRYGEITPDVSPALSAPTPTKPSTPSPTPSKPSPGTPVTPPTKPSPSSPSGSDGTDGSDVLADTVAGAISDVGPTRKILFLRVFPEALAQITELESDIRSSRYGQPKMYQITMYDPRTQVGTVGVSAQTHTVHWTRVVHIADNISTNPCFGVPACRPVINPIMDVKKVRGSSAEMYFTGALPGWAFFTNPQLGTEPIDVDTEGLKDEFENYRNGLQRMMLLDKLQAQSLAPQVVSPEVQIEAQLDAICIKLDIPKRIFVGSERGELSSAQDSVEWKDRVNGRRNNHVTPNVIVPLVDRFILLGVLPQPKGYSVDWPESDTSSKADKAQVAFNQSQALQIYVSGNLASIMDITDFLTRIIGFTEEEAASIVQAAEEAQAELQAEQEAIQAAQMDGLGLGGDTGQGGGMNGQAAPNGQSVQQGGAL
jgi:hypothetical protein